jgi:hypothetical protein
MTYTPISAVTSKETVTLFKGKRTTETTSSVSSTNTSNN